MNRLLTVLGLLASGLAPAACGTAVDDSEQTVPQPVEAREVSVAAGRMSNATYTLDFQLGRGPITTTATGGDLAAESATPLRSK